MFSIRAILNSVGRKVNGMPLVDEVLPYIHDTDVLSLAVGLRSERSIEIAFRLHKDAGTGALNGRAFKLTLVDVALCQVTICGGQVSPPWIDSADRSLPAEMVRELERLESSGVRVPKKVLSMQFTDGSVLCSAHREERLQAIE
jgi:hypothetical protein